MLTAAAAERLGVKLETQAPEVNGSQSKPVVVPPSSPSPYPHPPHAPSPMPAKAMRFSSSVRRSVRIGGSGDRKLFGGRLRSLFLARGFVVLFTRVIELHVRRVFFEPFLKPVLQLPDPQPCKR